MLLLVTFAAASAAACSGGGDLTKREPELDEDEDQDEDRDDAGDPDDQPIRIDAGIPGPADTGVQPAPPDTGVQPAYPDAAVEAPDAGGGAPDAAAGCVFDEDPFDVNVLQARVSFLASDTLEGRAPGSAGDLAARTHIEDRFRCLGLTPPNADGSYQQPFVTSENQNTANVVGYIPGSDPAVADQIIVITAHHDHLGIRNGRIYNGANDNASGVAAMLAVAQAIRQQPAAPKRTIAFIAFGFEENDGACEGSEYYVANPPAALPIDRVVYDINLDMVGLYALAESLTAYGAQMGMPATDALQRLGPNYSQLELQFEDEADEDASDFQAFCNSGVPYIYFETWDDDCYHQGCDDAARLDYANMASISMLSRDLALDLADSSSDLLASRTCEGS